MYIPEDLAAEAAAELEDRLTDPNLHSPRYDEDRLRKFVAFVNKAIDS